MLVSFLQAYFFYLLKLLNSAIEEFFMPLLVFIDLVVIDGDIYIWHSFLYL